MTFSQKKVVSKQLVSNMIKYIFSKQVEESVLVQDLSECIHPTMSQSPSYYSPNLYIVLTTNDNFAKKVPH